ncbi:MAG: radical SAM family heme chaperone HemW [Oscillospiraceae bacterium]
MNNTGIYIHIPFCSSKCGYCSFYSAPAPEKKMESYIDAVIRAIDTIPYKIEKVDTIYFGGGTPSLLGVHLLRCLDAIKQRYVLTESCEITLEANPASLTLQQLTALYKGGINRLSVGVQTLNEKQLKLLGRRHNAEQALQAVRLAKTAGFENISVDMMLGLPYQTKEDVQYFAESFSRLGVTHISAYILKIEAGTEFSKNNVEKICPDEDATVQLYLDAVNILEKLGYMQYEISNFAKEGKYSRHNTRYWLCEPYIGIGPSAHSFVLDTEQSLIGKRGFFPPDTDSFISTENVWKLHTFDDIGGDYEEFCMLGLRLKAGIDLTVL